MAASLCFRASISCYALSLLAPASMNGDFFYGFGLFVMSLFLLFAKIENFDFGVVVSEGPQSLIDLVGSFLPLANIIYFYVLIKYRGGRNSTFKASQLMLFAVTLLVIPVIANASSDVYPIYLWWAALYLLCGAIVLKGFSTS